MLDVSSSRYNLCFFLATYVFPTVGMGVCYAQMGLHLYRGDKTILQLVLIPPAALHKSRKDKKRVSHVIFTNSDLFLSQIVTMFAVVITIFIVCWAPYHVYFLLVYHLPSITQYKHIGHVYLSFYWLAMSNSCVNPIIYYWMNARFRAYFNQIFCFFPNVLKSLGQEEVLDIPVELTFLFK